MWRDNEELRLKKLGYNIREMTKAIRGEMIN
jgi:hypothetical protein